MSAPGLYLRTIRNMRLSQIVARLRVRTLRAMMCLRPGTERFFRRPVRHHAWPSGFVPQDAVRSDWPAVADLRVDRISLLGLEPRDVGDWSAAGSPRLWSFHLHYWDWAWALAQHEDRLMARATFRRLWCRWRASTRFAHGDAWEPYVVAVRLWAFCGLYEPLVAGSDIEEEFVSDVGVHGRYLSLMTEDHLGGNHLLTDLKALIGVGVFLDSGRLIGFGRRRLEAELRKQILPDGGHFERSPSYHEHVRHDLMDLEALLLAAGEPLPPSLRPALDQMATWTGLVRSPTGSLPLLNDGFATSAPGTKEAAGSTSKPDRATTVLADSGLVHEHRGPWDLLALVGAAGPESLPGHAHAHTLSFLLWVDGHPLLVDTGTSTYEPGERRRFERSTRAHNTVTIDGQDSSEVWGTFRAGRMATAELLEVEHGDAVSTIVARHDGYARLKDPVIHHRSWSVDDRTVTVEDRLEGTGEHLVALHWHLAAGARVHLADDVADIAMADHDVRICSDSPAPWQALDEDDTALADGFGRLRRHVTLRQSQRLQMPARIVTEFRLTSKRTTRSTD